MKTMLPSFRRFALTRATVCLALATLGAAHARAQANLTFSGGNGAPLSLTLSAPVTYVVTTAASNGAPVFDFQGVGNFFNNSFTPVGGSLFFTIDGGAAKTFTILNSGFTGGSVAATDAYIYGNGNSLPGVAVGDVVVLNAGTLTTTGNFAGALPAGGSFQTFLFDGEGNKLDAVNGVSVPVSVPETSSTLPLLLVGGAALLGLGRCVRRPAARRA